MTIENRLARECDVFARHLTGRAPTPYVVAHYVAAHAALDGLAPRSGYERWLVAVATRAPSLCRVADAWSGVATPRTALRRKLLVLLAILEVSPPFAAVIDGPARGPVREWAGMGASTLASLAALVGGLVLFLPARLLAGGRRDGGGGAGRGG